MNGPERMLYLSPEKLLTSIGFIAGDLMKKELSGIRWLGSLLGFHHRCLRIEAGRTQLMWPLHFTNTKF